jgi:hypothetical protein
VKSLGKVTYLPEDKDDLLERMDQLIASMTDDDEELLLWRRHSMRTV